ncbi:hypothetical protein GXW78_12190 [Roseomonas terrae]|jgi:hypothetical protein|uniref:Putative Flp pilus-assembly TadG-like N-terminal domain-containing protein n=1 Tax=Neoroseomonas terrae TaxID=424799 RepID=A0ABS5EHB8_9PROT|nr:TadE/TadG family type IV pilus assembly protein [Neoroseomonas terrae]MBR0650426.1 hypothetical protein [Neoroseomonas terrae]
MKTKLNRRGAIAALTAVVMVPVIGFAGLAIDLSRVWLLSARLKTSVDAASLIAARTMRVTTVNGVRTVTTDEAATRQLFWANFRQNGWSNSYLGSTTAQPVIEPITGSETRIRVTATASLNTTLFSIISRETTPLRETTVAERGGTGLELAIVLDQTSSMRDSATGFSSKLAAAQSAVGTLLRQIYGETNDTARNVFVSVVPFARTINIGTGNAGFINDIGMPAGYNRNNWSGCVEAVRGGQDVTDAAPTGSARFVPYYYPDTYRRVGWASAQSSSGNTNPPSNTVVMLERNRTRWRDATTGTHGSPARGANVNGAVDPYQGAGACTVSNNDAIAYPTITVRLYANNTTNSLTDYTVRFCHGDNDYGNADLHTSSNNDNYNESYANLISAGATARGLLATSASGPNMLCAMNAIMPLTASRSAVVSMVNGIQAPPRSGGTTIVTGMQGAWYTLSPNWRLLWPGVATSPDYGALPLAYGTRNMVKAVVILTDGDNNWQCAYSAAPSGTSSACLTSPVRAATPDGGPRDNGVEMLYNAYGRTADWNDHFGSTSLTGFTASPTQGRADTLLDGRFAEICRQMKGSNHASTNPLDHQIQIYIVGFEIRNPTAGTAANVLSMLRTCASNPDSPYFIEATDASRLDGAFNEIGNALSSLRLIE